KTGQRPLLFMSAKSLFETGKPIRGGVPICFPWFSNRGPKPDSPMHGFARTFDWDVKSIRQINPETVEVALTLAANAETKKYWPEDFEATHIITFSHECRMALTVQNLSDHPFKFEEALHTYFAVGDIRKTQLQGLAGVNYSTKVQGQQNGQGPDPIQFTAETDRIYANTPSTCIINDPAWNRKITVAKQNSF